MAEKWEVTSDFKGGHKKPDLVIIESPFAGKREKNIAYARAALRDSIHRGEAPIAFHLLYTQPGVLDDNIADERSLGISRSTAWYEAADKIVVYTDLGISPGMQLGMDFARQLGKLIEARHIGWRP